MLLFVSAASCPMLTLITNLHCVFICMGYLGNSLLEKYISLLFHIIRLRDLLRYSLRKYVKSLT